MKIRIEINDSADDEIIIRCRERDTQIEDICRALEGMVKSKREMVLYIGNTEHYVPFDDILFFETGDGRVYAHTDRRMYSTPHKLFELENMLPPGFVRISKSAIANVMKISSMSRELVGNGEICFYKTEKKTFFSRAYYKILKDRIEEIRFS